MKKVKINGKLKLNKEMILKLNDMDNVKGGAWGSIGARCTQPDGTCAGSARTKGFACNVKIVVGEPFGGC